MHSPTSRQARRVPSDHDARPHSHHHVQFYEDDRYLIATVGDFLTSGLSAGHPLVVFATEPHRAAFTDHLRTSGIDVDAATRSGRLAMLDARATLDSFMVGAAPDAARFRAVVGNVLNAAAERETPRPVVRLYGEMVDLLWRAGNTDGALRVEELWNEIASDYAFSLLCAYAMGNFVRASDAERFEQICRQHTHVAPTERYGRADGEARLLEIARLEQRAHALQTEIEHRKDLERRLRERERELRDLLGERDVLLAAERSARTGAESANRAKSDFLAAMSHELRTPLNAIAGHVQLIAMEIHGPVSDAQREALVRVDRSQRHLLSLINNVLTFARVEGGHVEYVVEEVDLGPLISETVAMLEPLLAVGNLSCQVGGPAPDTPAAVIARADREKTHQIVLNLLTNAIKFTPAGGCIRVEIAVEGGSHAVVRVSDTGIGIAGAQLEHIFEPFVQLGRTTGHQGVGLGLAISRDLARGMHGDLVAESALGHGATFTLRLPLHIER